VYEEDINGTEIHLHLVFAAFDAAGRHGAGQADPSAEMQKHFAEAYNRGDIDEMVAAFTETAVRVTPSGIFEGRDAIRRSFQDALKLGLHDYSVQRTISRSEGNFVFNAGKWQAKLGDHSFHGYYTAIVLRARKCLTIGRSPVKP
jgi:ketosteroid isomerase-like protein